MDKEKDSLKDSGRDQKGRFVKGAYKGGPGRKKEPEIPIDAELLDIVETVIRRGMVSKDAATRLKSAGLGIRIESLKKPAVGKVLEPFVERLVFLLSDLAETYYRGTGIQSDPIELIERMKLTCLGCDRLGTKASDWVEVEDLEDEDTL